MKTCSPDKTQKGARSGTLYATVAQDIRARISQGELQPGQQLPPFPELCRHYGVSNITIRGALRSLSQDGLIIGEQRKGVFIAHPAQKRTGVLGCHGVQHSFESLPYYLHLFKGIQNATQQAGYELLLLNGQAASFSWEKIDGLILCTCEDHKIWRQVPPGMCTVTLLHPSEHYPCVYADDYSGMREAVDYLVEMGHRKIAYMYEVDDLTATRMQGYIDALEHHGITPQRSWRREMVHFHLQEFLGRGRDTMRSWLERDWHRTGCTALLCQNDRSAMGAMESLREAGVAIPAEVSIIGFDGTDECELVRPRLTSVRVPLEEMGEKAVELIIAMVQGDDLYQDKESRRVTVTTYLEKRDSVSRVI